MFLSKIRQYYHEAVRLADAPSDLKDALKSHERVPVFVDNLADQFRQIQEKRLKPIEEKHIREIVYEMTDLFIASVKAQAEERYQTQAQKTLRDLKFSEQQNPELHLKELGINEQSS